MLRNKLRLVVSQMDAVANTVRMLSSFETLKLSTPAEHVLHIELNRPDKRNAMNKQFFVDMRNCFTEIAEDPTVRAVVLSGAGKHFTSGLDLMDYASSLMVSSDVDVGRRALQLRPMIKAMQESFSVIERCPQPVIAAVHSGCIGGGVDLICCADMRVCTDDMWLEIKEVDVGLAADLGTLQRLPKLVGSEGLVRELAYTARKMHSEEAVSTGLFNRSYQDKDTMLSRSVEMASEIATKSPVVISAVKSQLNYARDHSVDEGLDYIVSWNMGLLQSKDLLEAAKASIQREKPNFDNLASKL